jgi:hypothetical protein
MSKLSKSLYLKGNRIFRLKLSQISYGNLFSEELIIGGQIPSEIGSISQLKYLIIETTHKVPSEIGMLTKLGEIVSMHLSMIDFFKNSNMSILF